MIIKASAPAWVARQSGQQVVFEHFGLAGDFALPSLASPANGFAYRPAIDDAPAQVTPPMMTPSATTSPIGLVRHEVNSTPATSPPIPENCADRANAMKLLSSPYLRRVKG